MAAPIEWIPVSKGGLKITEVYLLATYDDFHDNYYKCSMHGSVYLDNRKVWRMCHTDLQVTHYILCPLTPEGMQAQKE